MLFNSNVFLQFFAAFLLLYYLVRQNLRARNWLLVAASYLFYGWWDYRFLSLLFISSLVDYLVGLRLDAVGAPGKRRLWLIISLAANLGILGFFKYYGFFVESFAALLEGLGMRVSLQTLNIVLPVGISFYTFQTMSYTLDVYRGKLMPIGNLVTFMAYVAFFPQLVAGPIERASHLLPQMESTRIITRRMVEVGIWLVLWGMFTKVVVADNLAPLVDMAYQQAHPSGPLVILGTIAFALQIYGDFSGYSDIARGLAMMLGFDLMINFNLPYLATSIREFWRRWHISLSTWLRDYLYIPLGGNRQGESRAGLNLFITMLLGGLWHGAAWHFVAWGGWHGLGLFVHRWWTRRRIKAPNASPAPRPLASWKTAGSWLLTSVFVLYGWLLFRATSIQEVGSMTMALADWRTEPWMVSYTTRLLLIASPLILMQIWQGRTGNLLAPLNLPWWARSCLQGAVLLAILLFWEQKSSAFIYFQF